MQTTLSRVMRIGLSAWLVQYLFLPAWFPSWGAIVPHDHITHGKVTEADWHAHQAAHQHLGGGVESASVATHAASDSLPAGALTKIVTVYHSDALISIESAWAATHDDALPSLWVPERVEKIAAFVLPAPRVFLALLDPPPKPIR